MSRVLFISGRCPHSKQILMGIHQNPFLKALFKIINIDSEPFPNTIEIIPSMIINDQIISGRTVFEYLGKLVEGKKQQETRESDNQLQESDQGQCRINEEGELEGYCGINGSAGIDFSMISEENDDYTKKVHSFQTNYDFLNGSDDTLPNQIKQMEQCDDKLSQKRKDFDNDYERLQTERGEISRGMGQGPGQRPSFQ